jgi:hypothetical protein
MNATRGLHGKATAHFDHAAFAAARSAFQRPPPFVMEEEATESRSRRETIGAVILHRGPDIMRQITSGDFPL